MAEKVESHAPREIGEIFEFLFAERNGELRAIKDNLARVGRRFTQEHDLDIRNLKRRLLHGDGGVARAVCSELNFPGPMAAAHRLVAGEESGVNDKRADERNQQMARQFISAIH